MWAWFVTATRQDDGANCCSMCKRAGRGKAWRECFLLLELKLVTAQQPHTAAQCAPSSRLPLSDREICNTPSLSSFAHHRPRALSFYEFRVLSPALPPHATSSVGGKSRQMFFPKALTLSASSPLTIRLRWYSFSSPTVAEHATVAALETPMRARQMYRLSEDCLRPGCEKKKA